MIYVIDTHALVFFLTGDPALGPRARKVMVDSRSHLVVPIYCFEEMRRRFGPRLNEKGMIRVPPMAALRLTAKCFNMRIFPRGPAVFHEENALRRLVDRPIPEEDLPICATAIAIRKVTSQEVLLISRDRKIRRAGLIPVVW